MLRVDVELDLHKKMKDVQRFLCEVLFINLTAFTIISLLMVNLFGSLPCDVCVFVLADDIFVFCFSDLSELGFSTQMK